MLASVSSLEEAWLVVNSGANIVDLKDPGKGALGALPLKTIRTIVGELNGVAPLSATIGDLPFKTDDISEQLDRFVKSGVDIIKIGVFGGIDNQETLGFLSTLAAQGSRIVLVLFAEDLPAKIDFTLLANHGIHGVMIDTRNKQDGNLRAKINSRQLRKFCENAKINGLLSGLAGSIGVCDIPELLTFNPDYLGFRGALCDASQRTGEISKTALAEVRSMIPVARKKNILVATG